MIDRLFARTRGHTGAHGSYIGAINMALTCSGWPWLSVGQAHLAGSLVHVMNFGTLMKTLY